MLDFPASGSALWSIYDSTQIRPEYLLPVLWAESNFMPNVQNHAGAPYYGLNQVSSNFLQAHGVDPSDYVTWPASQQLSQIVLPYLQGVIAAVGVTPKSGTRVEQANFYPASLQTATSLDSSIVCSPSAAYSGNQGLDFGGTGCITVQDLATFLTNGINGSGGSVQSAIDQTYALRSSESQQDPVYGTDFGAAPASGGAPSNPLGSVALAASLAFAAILAANAIDPSSVPRPLRAVRI